MATITFGSNNPSVNGTSGDDSMVGNDTSGNIHDIVYGHQGNDTINTLHGLFDSTVYGGQGNDIINDTDPTSSKQAGGNVIYGNLGNDIILSGSGSIGTEGDTIYGGQGNDTMVTSNTGDGAIYGNLGNDSISHVAGGGMNFYGGQGNDTIIDSASLDDVIYGNQGDDLLIGNLGTDNTHEYGGQGNDTLVFTGFSDFRTTNDSETGGQGDNLFVASDDSEGGSLIANDIVTVTDFLQGNDKLSESGLANIPLDKIALAAATATGA